MSLFYAIFVSDTKTRKDMEHINEEMMKLLVDTGLVENDMTWAARIAVIVAMLLIVFIVNVLFKHAIVPAVHRITASTKATWDDYLFSKKMLRGFCRVIDPIVVYILLPLAFNDMPQLLAVLMKVCEVYLIIVTLMLINTFLNTLYQMSNEHEHLRNRPLKGVYQMIKLISVSVGVIVAIAILMDSDATSIIAGLGASAAVLMLIFKDSILGLVAGVQLSANDMLRPGDWITMTKYGANGVVEEVSLTIVKVRNFDKTVTTIPPYALVSDSFQNWRGMWDTGARRIMRSIYIDVSTVRFLSADELENFAAEGLIDPSLAGSSRPVENLKVYRHYLKNYLTNYPEIDQNQMIMVRQLQPTPEGVPVELYCFTNTTVWPEYERIQADIFDHVLAITPRFGLKVFQRISSSDISKEALWK